LFYYLIIIIIIIAGISQRDATSYFEFLIEEKDELEDILADFYEDKIQNIFSLDACKKKYFYILFI
jgi:hypothetical protein